MTTAEYNAMAEAFEKIPLPPTDIHLINVFGVEYLFFRGMPKPKEAQEQETYKVEIIEEAKK